MLAKEKVILDNKNIATKIAAQEYKKIMNLVESGFFINASDFLREAIRDKLKEYETIDLRELPYNEAREEILSFCKKEQNFDICVIADELKLDLFFVNNIIEELIEDGIIEEVE